MTVLLQTPFVPLTELSDEPLVWQGKPFTVPSELLATEPAEARGLTRDGVRLLVGRTGVRGGGPEVEHHTFRDLPSVLRPGDLLVVNNSGTLPAALDAVDLATGTHVVLHVSTGSPSAPDA